MISSTVTTMSRSSEPLVVVQTNHLGREIVVCLAVEKQPIRSFEPKLPTFNWNSATPPVRQAVVRNPREFRDENSGAAETPSTSSSAWGDLLMHLRMSSIFASCSCIPRDFTIDSLVSLLFEDENPRSQREAAKKLAEISTVEEHRSAIGQSSQAIAGLTRLLFVDANPRSQYHAAIALGNLAAIEDNLESFKQSPEAVVGLVKLLFRYDEVLAQQEAAVALAKLSLFPDGRRMILDAPNSIRGLVGLAVVSHRIGQEDAQRALLNLALVRENRPILDCPMSLPVLAGILCPRDDGDEQNTNSQSIFEAGLRALASLAYSEDSAKKIAESCEFPRFLLVLVRLLVNDSSTTGSMEPTRAGGYGLAARKMAATALANLSVTKDTQRMVAEFPDALTGLFKSLQVQEEESVLSLQLQECAAMALGNLALVKENRRKIVDFGSSEGLECLANVLFQDDNPGGQECAAWAIANLSQDPYDSEEISVKIAETPNIVTGLARLLQLPTFGSRSRITMQEQSVKALANLTFALTNQVKLAHVPNVVKALAAALLCRSSYQNLNCTIQEYAAIALANLTYTEEVWKSSEFFSDSLRALVDVVSPANVAASEKARAYGTLALGNFLQESAHHYAVVDSKHAVGGLVTMLYGCGSNSVLGREAAAWALANLAQGSYSTKAAIASFPFALPGLLGSLSDNDSLPVRAQAMRALAGIEDGVLSQYCTSMLGAGSGAETSCGAGFTYRQLVSSFETPCACRSEALT